MIQENFEQNQELDKIFKDAQFQQIIKAIILGKYAWACVLFLHFAGCDPLDYIPHEIYSQLIQDNYIFNGDKQHLQQDRKLKFSGLKVNWGKFTSSKHSSN